MKRRLASLFLLLVFAGSAFAGVPLEFGNDECSMHPGMDCCKVARAQTPTPEVADAKLCCALNCAQNGMMSQPNVRRVTPPAVRASLHPALTPPALDFLVHRIDRLHGPPQSEPAYLRNLALLI